MSVSNIPSVKIGDLEFYLIQGGMGVGISQSGLASAVAEQGGAGIIASVGLGVLKGYFQEELEQNKDRLEGLDPIERKKLVEEIYKRTNRLALVEEIRRAREKSNGVVGVNVMYALSDFSDLAEAAISENIDLFITGAGFTRELPNYLTGGSKTKLVPIVSSGKLADVICRSWGRLGHLPDAIVVEGPKAGGHLGYSREQLYDREFVQYGLERIIPEVIRTVRKHSPNIPVIAAGGIFYGSDIKRFNDLGCVGVQMATRFVTTDECDAAQAFKQAYLDCREEDLVIINSPVGMPGRAIINPFLQRVQVDGERENFKCGYKCLKTCKQQESRYCIADALVDAQKGIFDRGFVFAGSNAHLCKKIVPVKEVFKSLDREYSQ